MEMATTVRGGGAALLRSDLRVRLSIPRCWPPIFRRTAPHCRHRSTAHLRHSGRSDVHLEEREHTVVHNSPAMSFVTSKAFNPSRHQEAILNSCELSKKQFLSGVGNDEECVLGGMVALGKFDALHIGHRELAVQASKAGIPFMLSFVGIAEVLGWETRPPLVAPCDRKRVLSSWAPLCSGTIAPVEYQVEFSKVRHLSPRQFIESLSKELKIHGVVAGENYRFGYKASGDASELVRLCKEYDLDAYIVSSVIDKARPQQNGAFVPGNSSEEQVSSTLVRRALAARDIERVTRLLGRKHRLVLSAGGNRWRRFCDDAGRISAPKSCMLNQPPGDGVFDGCTLLVDDVVVSPCRVVIDPEHVYVELDDGRMDHPVRDDQLVAIEFG